jgi:hypothetical protein
MSIIAAVPKNSDRYSGKWVFTLPPREERTSFLKKGNYPGMKIASTEGKRQRKRFFFEKKNQKTLTNSG